MVDDTDKERDAEYMGNIEVGRVIREEEAIGDRRRLDRTDGRIDADMANACFV